MTVEDTTDPNIAGQADIEVTTSNPDGRAVTFATPAASDIVDDDPSVSCDPDSGSLFPFGTTTVTCTATDDSGNSASTSFDVTVSRTEEPPSHTATARWLPPLDLGADGTATVRGGSNIPLKLLLTVDGHVVTTGAAAVTVAPCEGGVASVLPLVYKGGAWTSALKTPSVSAGCLTLAVTIDGIDAGAITVLLKGVDAQKAPAPKAHVVVPTPRHASLRRGPNDKARRAGHQGGHGHAVKSHAHGGRLR